MATAKNTPVRSDISYHRFNLTDELKRATDECGSCCTVCERGRLLYLAAANLLDVMKAHEQKERRIRRARRRGNLIIFPKAL